MFRAWREKKTAEREAVVGALSSNEPYLIMSLIRAGVLTVFFMTIVLVFMVTPLLSDVVQTLATPLFGFLSICAGFVVIPVVSRVFDG